MTDTSTDAPEAEAKENKTTKTPAPEGAVTAVQFAKEIDKHLSQADGTTKPQAVYGMIKNSKAFVEAAGIDRGEDIHPRWCVKVKEGLAFVDELQVKRAERAAKKAAKEKEEAAKPSTAAQGSDKPTVPSKG